MGKLKATTLSQKFGFKDEDLYTPTHDEIILHLLNETNMLNILEKEDLIKRFEYRMYISCEFCSYSRISPSNCNHKDSTKGVCFFDHSDWMEHKDKGPEYCPRYNDISWEAELLHTLITKDVFKNKLKIKTEIIVKNDRKFEIGFVDLGVGVSKQNLVEMDNFYLAVISNSPQIFFEIKTQIDSFGATMRQLNMYRENEMNPLILITCDDRFKEAFENQGIKVIIWGANS